MMEGKSSVATKIKKDKPKAIDTYCHGHSLGLAVKDLTWSYEVLFNTMSTIGEICILVKYSPKRKKILGSLNKNIEGKMSETEETEKEKPVSLSKLC